MTMILHLFKKDLRHCRILLGVWLLLVALQCVLLGSSARPGDLVLQGLYFTISLVVPLFQALILIVIIPLLVQEEPLVGTTGFWFTRPIAPSALLQAKGLFAAMLVILPLLAEVAVLAVNQVTPHDIGLAVPEILLAELSLIVTIAVLAILTPNFGRFAIAGAVLVVASLLVNLAITWLRLLFHPEAVVMAAQNWSLVKSRGVADSLLTVVGGGAVVVHQYLTRNTARSLAGALAVVLGTIGIAGFWPWDFLPPPPIENTGVKIDPASVKISLSSTSTYDNSTIRGVGAPQKVFNAAIEVTGLPAGCVAVPRRVHPRLSAPDGRPLPAKEPTLPGMMLRPDIAALESALDGIPVANPGYFGPAMIGLFALDADTFDHYSDQPLKLSATIDFVASKYVVTAAVPLVRGSRLDHGSEHSVITDVLHQGDNVTIMLHQRQMQLLFDPRNQAVPGAGAAIASLDRAHTVYVLRNPKRQEIVLQKQDFGVDFGVLASLVSKRLIQRTLRLSFGPEPNILTPELSPAWLADAELVRLQLVPIAEFSQQLSVDKLWLNRRNQQAPAPVAPNPDSLANLTLPAQSTKAQVESYVDGVVLAAQGRNGPKPGDPAVAMLLKVGPQNIDVLISAKARLDSVILARAPGLYLELAIQQLARPEDKDLILRSLLKDHDLISVVGRFGWRVEAHDTLVAALKDESQGTLPRAWIQAVASFDEPATYAALKAYLIRCSNRQMTYNLIRRLPGIDLRDAVEAAWKKARYSPNPHEVVDGCAMAADFGHLEALDALVTVLQQDDNENDRKQAEALFKRYTATTGDDDDLAAWFEANRDHLVFDAKTKKFVVPAAPNP
jgi:hypothetical protein